jgi:hypothetical protein
LGNVFKILKSEFLDNCEHKSKAVVWTDIWGRGLWESVTTHSCC